MNNICGQTVFTTRAVGMMAAVFCMRAILYPTIENNLRFTSAAQLAIRMQNEAERGERKREACRLAKIRMAACSRRANCGIFTGHFFSARSNRSRFTRA